jgi:hypothetical protein
VGSSRNPTIALKRAQLSCSCLTAAHATAKWCATLIDLLLSPLLHTFFSHNRLLAHASSHTRPLKPTPVRFSALRSTLACLIRLHVFIIVLPPWHRKFNPLPGPPSQRNTADTSFSPKMPSGETLVRLLLLAALAPFVWALPQAAGNAVSVANPKPGRNLTGKFLHITGRYT